MRHNGALVELDAPVMHARDTRALINAIMTEDKRDTLERQWEVDFAYSIPGVARYRINAYFQRGSVGAACRYLPTSAGSFADLGLPEIMAEFAMKPRGLVLVTGPTGSGKTTTLASVVDYINKNREAHIITIEDPIEYVHAHKRSIVTQREVGADTKGFADALHVLRQDPDVVLIGEMRDLDTIRRRSPRPRPATSCSPRCTRRTQRRRSTASSTCSRPCQQQQVRIQLASTLQGIVSQQLLPNPEGTGRVLVCEVLVPTPAVRNLIREAKTHQLATVMQTGRQYGMVTMDESLADKYRQGLISYDMALAQAHDPGVLRSMIDSTER